MNFFIFLLSVCLVSAFHGPQSNISKRTYDQRIISGEEARSGQFPFAASIYITTIVGRFFCGGTLLTNQWILTAGQCADGATHFDIQLGSLTLDGSSPYAVKVSTDTYVLHPEYDPLTLHNDIALIHLRLPVEFSTYLKPVDQLPYGDIGAPSIAVAIGWGQTSDAESGLVNELRSVHLYSWSNEDCKLVYGNQVTSSMVCASGNWNEGTCVGDSGSPLIQYVSKGRTLVAGVASFFSQNGCESPDPSGFTRVYEFKEWIMNITGRTE